MKKFALLASVASLGAIAFMSETTEVVLIEGKDGPVRVNKSDYDADQLADKPTMKLHKKDDAEQPVAPGAPASWPEGVAPQAAPAAPDFNGTAPEAATAPVIDGATGAVAPSAPSPNARFVTPEGTGAKKRFVITDANGTKITEGFDADGYATEALAWAAVAANPAV